MSHEPFFSILQRNFSVSLAAQRAKEEAETAARGHHDSRLVSSFDRTESCLRFAQFGSNSDSKSLLPAQLDRTCCRHLFRHAGLSLSTSLNDPIKYL